MRGINRVQLLVQSLRRLNAVLQCGHPGVSVDPRLVLDVQNGTHIDNKELGAFNLEFEGRVVQENGSVSSSEDGAWR